MKRIPLVRFLVTAVSVTLAMTLAPAPAHSSTITAPERSATTTALLDALFSDPNFVDVQGEGGEDVDQVEMTTLEFLRHLLDATPVVPPTATGHVATDLLASKLRAVTSQPDFQMQVEYVRSLFDNSTFVAELLLAEPRLNEIQTFQDPFGPSTRGLPTLKAVRRIVKGVGIAAGTVTAVVACGATVVCAVGAAVVGTAAFADNALEAAAEIQADSTETTNVNDGTTIIASLNCLTPGFCDTFAVAYNNNMRATGAGQTFVLVTATDSFDVPQSNKGGLPMICRNTSGQVYCEQYNQMGSGEPRLRCAVAVGSRVRFFWPNGTSSFDSAVTYNVAGGLC